MGKTLLQDILEKLKELEEQKFLAETVRNGRIREKRIKEAKLKISNYAKFLPSEVRGYLGFNEKADALCYQFADEDISKCVLAIENWIKEKPENSYGKGI